MAARKILKAGAAACLLLGVLLTGCSADDSADQPPAETLEAPRSFGIFLGDELGLIDFAVRRLRNECLADAGYPQDLELMEDTPSRPFRNLVVTEDYFGPDTEEEARAKGFGHDVPAQPGRVVSGDHHYHMHLEHCEDEAYAALGPDSRRIVEAYQELGTDLSAKFSAALVNKIEERMPDASERLLNCLEEAGYTPTDEETFLEEPDPRLLGVEFGGLEQDDPAAAQSSPEEAEGTVQVTPSVPAMEYVPTPEESELAVVWYGCRAEIGLTDALKAAAGEAQAEIVAEYEDAFRELNPSIQELGRVAAEVIVE